MKPKPDQMARLLELIELVNRVPKDGLPDLYAQNEEPMTLAELDDWWARKFSWLDLKLQKFIAPISMLDEASRKYRMLQHAAETIRLVAFKEGDEKKKPGAELARFSVALEVDSDETIVQIPNHLLHCLQGLKADRIRRCHCGNVFWAKRDDKRACSRKCANVRRVRKSRGSDLFPGTLTV
jgi:hypothetical protein